MSPRFDLLVSQLALVVGATSAAAADAELPAKAEAGLKAHCHSCHGRGGTAKGGMNYILDRDKLLVKGKIIPGRPDESPVYERLSKGEMPPATVKVRPSRTDLEVLRHWVEVGAVPARG